MAKVVEYGNYRIVPEELMYEVNFVVYTGDNYLFRLVPGECGFELSKLDKALNCDVDPKLVDQIGSWLTGYYA